MKKAGTFTMLLVFIMLLAIVLQTAAMAATAVVTVNPQITSAIVSPTRSPAPTIKPTVAPATKPPTTTAPTKTTTSVPTKTPQPTTAPPTATPAPTIPPWIDKNDPNVRKHSIYAYARTPEEILVENPKGVSGSWRSASKIAKDYKQNPSAYPGITKVRGWLADSLKVRNMTIEGKVTPEKMLIVRKLFEDQASLEKLIRMTRNNPSFTLGAAGIGDCAMVNGAAVSLSVPMEFEIVALVGCEYKGEGHSIFACWVPEEARVLFYDLYLYMVNGVWGLPIDQLDEHHIILD